MSASAKVMESFNHCVDKLIPELKKISDIDCEDSVKASKLKRKIEAWFRNYGKVNKS